MHILFLDLYFLQPFYSFFFFGAAYWIKISIDHFCACLFIQYSFVSCLFNLFAFYIQQHATDNIQKEILDRNKIQEAKIERKKKKDKKTNNNNNNSAQWSSYTQHWNALKTQSVRNMIRWNGMEAKKVCADKCVCTHERNIELYLYACIIHVQQIKFK